MPANRPAIPRALERQVKMEAGHRCAIAACRTVPVELAHIKPWSEVLEHTFDNLIALCPTCHARYDRGDIDKTSMLQYKANLSVLNGRYGDLERRILRLFAENPGKGTIRLGSDVELLIMYLLEDGILTELPLGGYVAIGGTPTHRNYGLTSQGRAFIRHWLAAQPLEP